MMKLKILKNGKGDPYGIVSEYADEESREALLSLIHLIREDYAGDLEIFESIPNDKGFIERPFYSAYPATNKTPKKPQYTSGGRGSGCVRYLLVAESGV